jgi:hypothetical protein
MYSVEIAGRELVIHTDKIEFCGTEIAIKDIDTLRVINTDTFVNGVWVKGTRIISLRGAAYRHLDN